MANGIDYDKTYFDPMKYAIGYCMLGCRILKAGYLHFRKSIKDFTNLNIDRYITIQSLANSYIKKQKCMEDVVKVSGKAQAFISKASVGGRVMTNSNKMYHVTGKLADFDANGLYPSAMTAISGFPKGIPHVLDAKELNMKCLNSVTEYYVEIEVTKVGKCRDFPLGSYYDKGSRNWTNDLVGKTIVVGRMTLEDLIHFQKIEFDIIRGYYFNEGHNNKINELITHLYNERLKMKKEGNPAQQAVKLLTNSIYGNCCRGP